jgi:hypothetical protein
MLEETPVLQQQKHNPFQSVGSRAEMEKFHNELPAYVQEGLKKGKLHYADTIIYSIKPVDSKTIKMFLPQDDKETGLRNISDGKLPKNQCLLVSGIWMLTASADASTKDVLLSSMFMYPELCPALMLGEFSLKANQKYIVPETSNMLFRSSNITYPYGYYKLHNPRLIVDEVSIEFTLELATLNNVLPNTHVLIGLHGTITTP